MEIRKMAIVSGVTGAFCLLATSAMAQVAEIPNRYGPFDHGHDMMWGSSQWGGFGMILGPIFMILILAGIVAAIVYLARLFGATGPGANGHAEQDRSLALLRERYAKGEIDSEEFAERKKLLTD